MELWATSASFLVAIKTWLGSVSPEAQAEPVDTIMSCASRYSWMDSPSAASKLTFKIFGREFSSGVLSDEYGISFNFLCMHFFGIFDRTFGSWRRDCLSAFILEHFADIWN